jgi:hypothetical protein
MADDIPADPGSTEGSVFTPPEPYKVGSGGLQADLPEPENRREAFLMAKSMIEGSRPSARLTPNPTDIVMVADWLLGMSSEAKPQERPETPNPIWNTASAYEPLRRERPSGLAFLYHHPPCHAVEWRNATESLTSCMVEGCSMRTARWEVLYKEKNA